MRLFRSIARAKRDRDIKRLGDGNYYRYLHAQDERKWESVLTGFTDIQAIAEQNDIPVLLVVFPFMHGQEWPQYPYRDLHRQVVSAGEDRGFHTLDLYDAYSKHAPRKLMSASGNPHPSALGHRVAAEAIYGVIRDHGLLSCM